MNSKQYLIDSEKTMALQDENQRVLTQSDVMDAVEFCTSAYLIDGLKRKTFYKDENFANKVKENCERVEKLMLSVDSNTAIKLTQHQMNVLHAAEGIASEAGEILEHVIECLVTGKEFDKVNLKEESGDVKWYDAIICRECEFTPEDAMETNIKKLSKRYPNKFTTEAAVNRDTDAERKILEE